MPAGAAEPVRPGSAQAALRRGEWVRSDAPARSPSAPLLSEPELRIFARILLYLAQQPRFGAGEPVPVALTQAGVAEALGASVPSVSNALHRLVAGGAVGVVRGHVRGKHQRLKVYQLSDEGLRIAHHIRESMTAWRTVTNSTQESGRA